MPQARSVMSHLQCWIKSLEYGLMVQIYAGLITSCFWPFIVMKPTRSASVLAASGSCEYKSRTNCVNPATLRMNTFSKNNLAPGYMQKSNRTMLQQTTINGQFIC